MPNKKQWLNARLAQRACLLPLPSGEGWGGGNGHTLLGVPVILLAAMLAGCAAYSPPQPSSVYPPALPTSGNHIQADQDTPRGTIPEPVKSAMLLPPPKPSSKPQTYSVVVNEVPVKELLFALARDSGMNIDVYPTIRGVVTLNAIDETLPAILERVVKQLDDLRYEIDGKVIRVMPDTPYLKTYRINYVNIKRETTLESTVDTGVAKTGVVGAGGGGGVNALSTKIKSTSQSHFWDLLIKNVEQLLRDTDKRIEQDSVQESVKEFASQNVSGTAVASGSGSAGFNVGGAGGTQVKGDNNVVKGGGGSGAAGSGDQLVQSDVEASQKRAREAGMQRFQFREKASVIANPETGMLAVRATSRQHQAMQEFLSGVLEVAKRQVLIEATIVEVKLSDAYQGGVDWSRVAETGKMAQDLLTVKPGVPAGFTPHGFSFVFKTNSATVGNISAAVKLLETFGDLKVHSSPKLMALNNQTAVLQAVVNQIYFNVKVTPPIISTVGITPAVYETIPQSVAEGVVMAVTPQINENGQVALTIRPTITRIVSYVNDPNPDLATAGVTNQVPVLQVHTMESVLQVKSGHVLVMGGLMQDKTVKKRDGLPILSRIPTLGDVFSYRDDVSEKSELVIFLKPTVIENSGVWGENEERLMADYLHLLPKPGAASRK
jgi:MSHA biogenesis protein MshL